MTGDGSVPFHGQESGSGNEVAEVVSWRESASAAAQADLDGLLEAALDMAESRVAESGEFYPFGVVVDKHGRTEIIAAGVGSAQEAQRFVYRAISDRRRDLRAAAVATDVRLPETTGDAIEVHLEHAEGTALGVLEPYRIEGEDVVTSSLRAYSEARKIWM
ncbi:hypothetical protein [Nocardia sp. NPDC050710]|uniref:hypothetical protein n=1 Tax=Nocardia sp. NPDC050710 TaxID=3157220 RepID=UPI0033E1B915